MRRDCVKFMENLRFWKSSPLVFKNQLESTHRSDRRILTLSRIA
uniref:Uncharacterized protein n=1 Tax=Ralstonia solanacearum TaxID=305 RepID=A0A0S4WZ24_RALSL|nr:protein of unknown function [Ralstonia solanacearum]